jgi:DNA-directed RNA polymerase specialized sigma24 family protein
MDHAELVRLASGGELKAFVELLRRFQHAAFGSALALTGDFQEAEDVVQEAFVAAWSALPSLTDPAAFPGWLRTIVRRYAWTAVTGHLHPYAASSPIGCSSITLTRKR